MAIMTGVQSPNLLGPNRQAQPATEAPIKKTVSSSKYNIDFVR
jgi:hypothetical protein